MNRNFKKISFIILAIVALFIIGTVSANYIIKNKLEKFIKERLPDNMIRAYDDITVETFSGSLSVLNTSLIIKNKEDNVKHTFLNVEKLKISNISYWDYLFSDEIHVKSISLENPIITYYQDKQKPSKDTVRSAVATIYKPIIVDHIKINNTKLTIYEEGKDSTKVYANGLSLNLDGIKVDNRTVIREIPFEYKNFEAKSDTVFVKVGTYENLTVENFSVDNNVAVFNKLKLKTKYSKKELSTIIPKERDHYDLSLESLSIEEFDFGFENSRFFAKSKMITLETPILDIYRDKLVTDDLKPKPLYSKMLRDLPFALTVDSLKITDAKIKYAERQKPENMGGSINFENLNAAIANVSNTYKSPTKTNLKVTANFMGETPLTADWSFDVQNKADQFLFKAEVGSLIVDKMNSFTEPNLKIRLEGRTNKTYFTIDGNNDTSRTDLKMNYSNFEIIVLQKDGETKNKVLSTIANIFVSKDSSQNEDQYREGTAEATRDKTKSVFNFLWTSVKNALTKALTGSGKIK